MTRHTPGPWHIHNPSKISLITVFHRSMTHKQICDMVLVGMDGNTELAEEELSNARLISAAPTMYTYLLKQAEKGDEEAKEIVRGIDAEGSEAA